MVLAHVRQHINTLVQVRAILAAQARLVAENIQLVLVLMGMSGRMGCARSLAIVLINTLVVEQIFRVVQVRPVAASIRLVLVRMVMNGKTGLALAIKLARSAIFCTPITLVVLAM